MKSAKDISSQIALAENLQKLLRGRGENWGTVARRISMNRSTLYNWTYGVAPSSLKSLVRLSDYFGVSLNELCLPKGGTKRNPDSVTLVFKVTDLELNPQITLQECTEYDTHKLDFDGG